MVTSQRHFYTANIVLALSIVPAWDLFCYRVLLSLALAAFVAFPSRPFFSLYARRASSAFVAIYRYRHGVGRELRILNVHMHSQEIVLRGTSSTTGERRIKCPSAMRCGGFLGTRRSTAAGVTRKYTGGVTNPKRSFNFPREKQSKFYNKLVFSEQSTFFTPWL